MVVLCAAADGRALIKKKQNILYQRLLRLSGIPVFTVIFTVRFLCLQIPCLLHLTSNSITCISTPVTSTVKFHYFQILHSSRNYTLPLNSNTCKFQNN